MPFSIRKKGLLIVAVPLLFQFVFVGLLLKELDHAEQEARKEAHAREIIAAVDRLFTHVYEACGALYAYANIQEPTLAKNFDDNIKLTYDDLQFLKDNSEHDSRIYDFLSSRVKGGIDLLVEHKRLIQEGRLVTTNADRLQGYVKIRKIVSTVRQLADLEHSQYSTPGNKVDQSRNAVRQLIYWGLFGNVIIALGVAAFFARNVERSIQRILHNLKLFAGRAPLQKPPPAGDEIAAVDRALYEMAEDLKQSERMKESFVAMISHDIRTPVTAIKNTLDMLSEEPLESVDKELRMLVCDAASESRRLMTLTNNLVDLTRLEQGKFNVDPRPLQLSNAVERALGSLRLFARRKSISIESHSCDFEVMADHDRLLQVLINLLSNAIKYSPERSTITVSAVARNDDRVEMSIADQGPGIPEDERERVFEQYERVAATNPREEDGMGLGLAICKAIVVAHGGTIGVRKSQSGGSDFWLTLAQSTPATAKEPRDEGDGAAKDKKEPT